MHIKHDNQAEFEFQCVANERCWNGIWTAVFQGWERDTDDLSKTESL